MTLRVVLIVVLRRPVLMMMSRPGSCWGVKMIASKAMGRNGAVSES